MKSLFYRLMACTLVCAAFVYTSCTKDLQNEVTGLGDRLTAVENSLKTLQSKIDAGAVVTGVESTATGVKVTLSNGETFDLKHGTDGKDGANGADGKDGVNGTNGKDGVNGNDGKPGSVVTIVDGVWHIDGVSQGIAAKGDKGDKGDTGAAGAPGAAGAAGKDGVDGKDGNTIYFYPNLEKNVWVKVENGKETETDMEVYVPGTVTAVWNTTENTLELANVQGYEGTLKLSWVAVELNVQDILARIQSLVFVPEYTDGKGTINYALVEGKKFVPGVSVLKYKVNAAEADLVATAIAANASSLSFEITEVETRSISAAPAPVDPALEIVGVAAEKGYLNVSVRPVGFSEKFFEGKNMYSASLLLKDKEANKNNYASEFTNLTRTKSPLKLSFDLFLAETPEGVGTKASPTSDVMLVSGATIPATMPANDYTLVKTAVQPIVGFLPVDETILASRPSTQPYFTAEELKAAGYVLDYKVKANVGLKSFESDMKNAQFTSEYFVVRENPEMDFNFTVSSEKVTDFKLVGKKETLNYTATFQGVSKVLNYDFILSNAQVSVYIGELNEETGEYAVDSLWTVKAMSDLTDNGVHYGAPILFEKVPYHGVKNLRAALQGKSPKTTTYIKNAAGEWVSLGANPFAIPNYYDGAIDLKLFGGRYSWNNSYKVVWTSTAENTDFTVTAIVNLINKPESINVKVEGLKFKMTGTNEYYSTNIDLAKAAYTAIKDYYGYPEDTWNVNFEATAMEFMAGTSVPQVNGKAGKVGNLNNLTEARIYVSDVVKATGNTITWSYTPWWGVPVNFTLTGDVEIPENMLKFSDDYAIDQTATSARVEANGTIKGTTYIINEADLAKYFVVTGAMNGHNLTVKFETTNTKVSINKLVTPVEDNKASYLDLTRNNAVLNWNEYTGLEVAVKATLYVNGYKKNTLDLTLFTVDPLKLEANTGTNVKVAKEDWIEYTVAREQFKDGKAYVHDAVKVVDYLNKDILTHGEALNKAQTKLAPYSGAVVTKMGTNAVYYLDANNEKVYLGTNKYSFVESTGQIVIFKDDATLQKTYYAEFQVNLKSRICSNPTDGHTANVRVIFTPAK